MDDLNEILGDYAEAFAGRCEGDGDIAFPHWLHRARLDYSLDSLRELDRYLQFLHERPAEFPGPEYENTVLWAGAYLGEVIRRSARRGYEWIDYPDYIALHPEHAGVLAESFGTRILLCPADDDGVLLPIEQVLRFLNEGPEHSTYCFAAGAK